MTINLERLRLLFARTSSASSKVIRDRKDLITSYFGMSIRATQRIDQYQGKEHVHPLQKTSPCISNDSKISTFDDAAKNATSTSDAKP